MGIGFSAWGDGQKSKDEHRRTRAAALSHHLSGVPTGACVCIPHLDSKRTSYMTAQSKSPQRLGLNVTRVFTSGSRLSMTRTQDTKRISKLFWRNEVSHHTRGVDLQVRNCCSRNSEGTPECGHEPSHLSTAASSPHGAPISRKLS